MTDSTKNARDKLGRVLEIYTPFGAARANAVLAMTAAVTEFEAAIREDERAIIGADVAIFDAQTRAADALARAAQAPAPLAVAAPVETPPPPAPEPVSRDEGGTLGVDTPNAVTSFEGLHPLSDEAEALSRSRMGTPAEYQGEGLPPLNYMPDFANGGPLEANPTTAIEVPGVNAPAARNGRKRGG